MIKGSGKLEMSEPTVVLALQEYLDRRCADDMSPEVTSVRAASMVGGYPTSPTFIVEIRERTAEKAT